MKTLLRNVVVWTMVLSTTVLFSQCSKRDGRQKIKLDGAAVREAKASTGLATTIQIQPEERRSIGVFCFENVTEDEDLDWMRRGLMEMLITDLSQSRYVDVFGEQGLAEIMERMGITDHQSLGATMAISVGREARLETVLVGGFARIGETIRIDVQLYETRTGNLLKSDRVECRGLEEVFPMVDELTKRVRDGLRPTLKGLVEFDKDLADATTSSIEAYRYFTEGLERFDKYFYDDAAEYFERAVEIDTTFATAYARLAISYAALSRGRDTRNTLAKAVALIDRVTERERLNIIALDAELNGDSKRVLETYEKMVQLFPRDKEAHFRLANVYSAFRRYDEAIREYEAALEIDNTYIHPYNFLGYLYARRGQYDKGVETLRQYMELVPDEPNPHDSIGEICQEAGRFDDAIDEFKRALKLKSDFYFSWGHMGTTYMNKGEFDQALNAFRRYIDVCPSGYLKSDGIRSVGEIQWARGKYKEALKTFREALKVYPDNYSLVTLIGDLFTEQGDTSETKKFQEEWFWSTGERILEEDNFAVVRYFLQTCLVNNIHPEELDPYLDKMMELAENDLNRALCTYLQGVARLQEGQTDSALADFREAVPPFFSLETRQGLSRFSMKNISQALTKSTFDPEERLTFYGDLVDLGREMANPTLEASARYLIMDYFKSTGDDEALERELKATGTPRESDWWIIGPFDNNKGFHHRFPPERRINLTKSYKGKGGKVHWRQEQDSVLDGYVDLKELIDPEVWTVAYGFLTFDCPTARQAQLRIGTNEATKVWLNEQEVWVRNLRRDAFFDSDIVPVELAAGTNTILIKVCQIVDAWGFYFRVTDPQGNPFDDITFLPQIVS
ncbi:MAG: tetratricopeptide repeat protein [Gemmatimonadota bacterium]|nr:MAG: tetratricopeptide repeat protein [Gemmatimonadota bacterium]